MTTTINDDDVYWQMVWGEKFPHKPPTEMIFEEAKALARLLAEDVVFLNCYWWEEEWPERAQKVTALCVNCNDIFAWACADAEDLPYGDIQPLYDMWFKDPHWGAAKWCAIKRNQKPQPPVIEDMKKAGSWDEVMEALGSNTQDAETQALFASLRGAATGHEVANMGPPQAFFSPTIPPEGREPA
jgi:hypothetical protein